MRLKDNPNWFANSPLVRPNTERSLDALVEARLAEPESVLLPLWRGDPLIKDGRALFLSAAARSEFPNDAPLILLGEMDGVAHFAIDASGASEEAEGAPFADIGEYLNMRAAAAAIPNADLAIAGHARWLFEWRRQHTHCARCGAETNLDAGGAKSTCPACGADHFPRTDPVAIVLAIHDDACLLGRNAKFPAGFLSALAGFVEAGETPEEAAKRELFEEAGVHLDNIRYQFSQPWPFSASLMMGFIADAENRELTLDQQEIVEGRWIEREDIMAILRGEPADFFIPPKFTIARQLIERWAGSEDD